MFCRQKMILFFVTQLIGDLFYGFCAFLSAADLFKRGFCRSLLLKGVNSPEFIAEHLDELLADCWTEKVSYCSVMKALRFFITSSLYTRLKMHARKHLSLPTKIRQGSVGRKRAPKMPVSSCALSTWYGSISLRITGATSLIRKKKTKTNVCSVLCSRGFCRKRLKIATRIAQHEMGLKRKRRKTKLYLSLRNSFGNRKNDKTFDLLEFPHHSAA